MTGDDDLLREEKRALRRLALGNRRVAHAASDASAAARLARHLMVLIGTRRPGIASGYHPVRAEIDVGPCLEALRTAGWTLALPAVAGTDSPLRFHRWAPGDPLTPGPLGIPVPLRTVPVTPDLVLVPLLAFDRTGHRLGYGKGCYDRTLAMLKAEGPVTAVGIAYAAQELDALPRGPYDVPLDAIVTERGPVAITPIDDGVTPQT